MTVLWNRTCSSSLLCVIIARNHLPLFKIFWNFVHFCPNCPIFCPFLLFFNVFLPCFCSFFWKIVRMLLLSRIGPVELLTLFQLCEFFPQLMFFNELIPLLSHLCHLLLPSHRKLQKSASKFCIWILFPNTPKLKAETFA